MDSLPNPSVLLRRIAEALERLAGTEIVADDLTIADAFVWHTEPFQLRPVSAVSYIPIHLLQGIDNNRDKLLENTHHFAAGLSANNVLLWGARGSGKSSLVKAVHAAVNKDIPPRSKLALVEIHREDIPSLPRLLDVLRKTNRRSIIFCDDLSFDHADSSYKSLKTVLEGGVEGRPDNVVFYATSNRRHLMPRDMIDNERAVAIIPGEAIEERVSLSDRFGLWLGFHHCDQKTYLKMVAVYAEYFALPIATTDLAHQALEWSVVRGARSGRVAWQFIQDLAARLSIPLKL